LRHADGASESESMCVRERESEREIVWWFGVCGDIRASELLYVE